MGPVADGALSTYKRLVQSVLGRSNVDEGNNQASIVASLRDALYRLTNQMKVSSTTDKNALMDMEELLMATHYQHMFFSCKANGMKELAAKCAITLLKYPFILSQDKAFYQAGSICRELGNTNLAFMLLNRLVVDCS